MTRSENVSYRDVKRVATERILGGIWPPGSNLPSEVELAKEFACTRTTVNRAMRELAEEGYLERKRKAGTRVRTHPLRQAKLSIPLIKDEIEATGATYRYSLVSRNRLTAPDWLIAQLDLEPDAQVLHLNCMHYGDNRPFAFEDRWINIAAVPDVESVDFAAVGPNEWLVETIPYTKAAFSFSAVNADPRLAEFLGIQPGEPILLADRITWLRSVPVTHAVFYYRPGYRLKTSI
ncbi:putative HTH-type transcriptional regulator YurK [Defluviimonas aquaemixtae]|uniref:Putative HTH-type transcriptional regulator YurK n=1 Tax=Albidovulum aquaemixtae TaxID=1542388 RepID=A0A2R8B4J9_9RHOB|nr:UTRA domain-containing protein [Defluviimonas aquaemixtae]SPH17502.1 putative HTH-type transcriptional regulator YurK [Defluviimonas aquaemixtae]